jgi:hypothetical protein
VAVGETLGWKGREKLCRDDGSEENRPEDGSHDGQEALDIWMAMVD